MRIVFTIIIGINGIIHLFGFLKAFGITEFKAISEPISKPFGIIWLTVFILFTAIAILFLKRYKYWWAIGISTVFLSQFLLITCWSDAKFGTILNFLILVSAIIGYSTFSFNHKVNAETTQMFLDSQTLQKNIVSEQMIVDLPSTVQNWLLNSGMVGKAIIKSVFLEQDLQLLMKPEQKAWSTAKAKQHFTIEPPAFNWLVSLKMNPLMQVVGRDKFENGKGTMTIKLFSLIPIINARNNKKVNQATLQRYLAEIVWFPSAALSPYITWDAIDDHSANATMTYHGTKGSGIFHFDENGNFKKFIAMRYKDANHTEPTEWKVTAIKTEVRNGIKIPVESSADWKLEQGNWTWLKLKITNIAYNLK